MVSSHGELAVAQSVSKLGATHIEKIKNRQTTHKKRLLFAICRLTMTRQRLNPSGSISKHRRT